MPLWVRPQLFPPDHMVATLSSFDSIDVPIDSGTFTVIPDGWGSHPALLDCLASHGIRVAVTYQPASRYWAFQWTETAIYVAFALALAGYCFWRIRRRIS